MRRQWVVLAIVLSAAMSARAGERPVRFNQSGEPYPETVPSFDCRAAAGYAERTVCANTLLGWSDRSIAYSYGRLLAHAPESQRLQIRDAQRRWLAERGSCKTPQCLSTLYDARDKALSAELARVDAALRAPLKRPGDCMSSRIDEMAGRLTAAEGEPPNGATVGFANGVTLTDYDRPKAFERSRIGDPVTICLVSLPKHCPPGDDRGRIYSVLNLRTQGRFKMMDSEHSCGGA
jgi:hypothetical protein